MLKLMGSFLILAGGVLVRQRCVRAWRQEQEALASLAGALERLALEVRATALPLPRLLSEAAGRSLAGAGEGLRGSEEQVCRSLEAASSQLERSLEDARRRERERERQASRVLKYRQKEHFQKSS